MSLLVIGAIAGTSAVASWLGWTATAHTRRTNALQKEAASFGARVTQDGATILAELDTMPWLRHGTVRSLWNVVRHPVDDAVMFDYQYTFGSGRDRFGNPSHTNPSMEVYRQTIVLVRMQGSLPEFEMFPEGVIFRMLGSQDIDFAQSPAFSRSYVVRGPDEPAIRATFTVGVTAHFEREPGWHLRAHGKTLLLWRGTRLMKPSELRTYFDSARLTAAVFGL